MKKLKMKILSVILVISLLLSVFVIYASADENTLQYSSVAHHYFESLGSGIPTNVYGSCTLVAISMLLSFYDIYWNDVFVDAKYESENAGSATPYFGVPFNASIGIKLENDDVASLQNKDQYMAFALANAGEYLHMKLISIAASLPSFTESDSTLGLSSDEYIAVLDKYFDDIFGQRDYYREDGNYPDDFPVTIHRVSQLFNDSYQDVIDAIENQVIQGNPVIYSGDDDDGRHAMVAYAKENYDILLHRGYSTSTSIYTTVSRTEYNYDISAVWIEINEDALPHQCSGSYTLAGLNDPICSCKAYRTLHPKHTHEMGSYMSEYDSNKHKYRCKWGCIVEAPHAFRSISQNNSYHGVVCDCGYTVTESHIFIDTANPRYMRCSICSYTKDNWGPGQNVQMGYEDGEEKE